MVPINWLSNGPKLFNFERPYYNIKLQHLPGIKNRADLLIR